MYHFTLPLALMNFRPSTCWPTLSRVGFLNLASLTCMCAGEGGALPSSARSLLLSLWLPFLRKHSFKTRTFKAVSQAQALNMHRYAETKCPSTLRFWHPSEILLSNFSNTPDKPLPQWNTEPKPLEFTPWEGRRCEDLFQAPTWCCKTCQKKKKALWKLTYHMYWS